MTSIVWTGRRRPGGKPKGYPIQVQPSVATDLVSELQELLKKHRSFGNDYLSNCVQSKYLDPEPGSAATRRCAAIEKLLDCEQLNSKTNLRLLTYWRADFGFATAYDIVQQAKCLIENIIGIEPPRPYPLGCHTNGASTDVRRHHFAAATKYLEGKHITQEAIPHFKEAMYSDFGLDLLLASKLAFTLTDDESFSKVQGNSLFTVPKKSDIDRCSAKEPSCNMLLQRGIGSYISSRLRRVGININDQSRNQRLAKHGSTHGNLATVDLSAASDSITIELVRLLLPHQWFCYLNDIRSKRTTISHNGQTFTHTSELFSTMGNGFTFELETLIFYALTRSLAYLTGTKGVISVYGDDIICPVELAPMLEKVFQFFGFRFNRDKSFWKGGFRESCGKHYFHGADISPFFIRSQIKRLPDLIRLLNQYRAWIVRTDAHPDFIEHWIRSSALIPQKLHGGNDVEASDSLTTVGLPRCRLVEITNRSRPRDDYGAYLEWLHRREIGNHTTDSSEPLVLSTKGKSTTVYRLRPVYPKEDDGSYEVVWPDRVDSAAPLWCHTSRAFY